MQKQSNNICTNQFQQFMHLPGHHDCQARAKNFAFLQFGEIPKNKFPEEPLNPGFKGQTSSLSLPFFSRNPLFQKILRSGKHFCNQLLKIDGLCLITKQKTD